MPDTSARRAPLIEIQTDINTSTLYLYTHPLANTAVSAQQLHRRRWQPRETEAISVRACVVYPVRAWVYLCVCVYIYIGIYLWVRVEPIKKKRAQRPFELPV